MNVLIIGGSAGLGKALTGTMSEFASKLFITGRDSDKLSSISSELPGIDVHTFAFELGDMTGVENFIIRITSLVDRLDVVANVAGGSYVGRTDECDTKTFQYMIDAYVRGQSFLLKGLLPLLRKSERGLIINFLSDWVVRKGGMESGNALYTMTKAALAAFSETLVSEEHFNGIRTTNLYLGELSETQDLSGLMKDEKGNPDLIRINDVCDFVTFLLKNETIHLTEAILTTKSPSYARRKLHTDGGPWHI